MIVSTSARQECVPSVPDHRNYLKTNNIQELDFRDIRFHKRVLLRKFA